MNLHFSKRWYKYFGKHDNKNIKIEIAGWDSHPAIYLSVDASESEVTFHFAFFIGIWISFARIFPKWIYPPNYGEREIAIRFHHAAVWWNFWTPADEWNSKTPKYRNGSFHFDDFIKGKHHCERTPVSWEEFVLPFLEGTYKVKVTQFDRVDSWKRWPSRRSVSFEVEAEGGVPCPGKGESSWDQDENATFSISMPAKVGRRTPYDAALSFWKSVMKSRERHGSKSWLPERFKDKKIQIVNKLQHNGK